MQKWPDLERSVADGLRAGRLAGTIGSRQDRRTKKGTPMAILSLSDQGGSYECIAFSEQVAEYSALLQPGASVIIEVEADQRPDGVSLRLIRARSIEAALEGKSRAMLVEMDNPKPLAAIKAQLKERGDGEVTLMVSRDSGRRRYRIRLSGGYRLNPALAQAIKSLEGVVEVKLGSAA